MVDDMDNRYRKWLEENRLPASFPTLSQKLPLERLYRREYLLGRIIESINEGQPLKLICTPGHGMTTLGKLLSDAVPDLRLWHVLPGMDLAPLKEELYEKGGLHLFDVGYERRPVTYLNLVSIIKNKLERHPEAPLQDVHIVARSTSDSGQHLWDISRYTDIHYPPYNKDEIYLILSVHLSYAGHPIGPKELQELIPSGMMEQSISKGGGLIHLLKALRIFLARSIEDGGER